MTYNLTSAIFRLAKSNLLSLKDRTERGADAAIDCAGVPGTMLQGLEVLKRGGVLCLGGICRPEDEVSLRPFRLVMEEITIRGAIHSPFCFPTAIGLIARKRITVEPMVTHQFPFDRIEETLKTAEGGRSLKVVILPRKMS